MAENDFLSGLLGGVKDVGSSIYGGISGLLGGGEQTPAAGGTQMPDSMSMLSPADQRRLMFSTLGQVGAALLAAGARQSPESRAQALAQLGKIGPSIEESIQRNAALQQQRAMAQRQAELFAPQLMAAKAGAAEKELSLKMQQETLAAQNAIKKLRDENPEALAKDLGLSAGYVKAMPIADLVEATKQIAIKRATKSPLEALYETEVARALNLAVAPTPGAMPPVAAAPIAPPSAAPVAAAPAAPIVATTEKPAYAQPGYDPTSQAAIAQYLTPPAATQAAAAPVAQTPPAAGGVVSMPTPTNPEAARLRAIAGNPAIYLTKPDEAKKLAELADKIDPPGAVEAAKKVEVAKAEMRLSQPKVEQALAGTMMKSENLSGTLSRAIDRVNNWSAGYGSMLSYIPETQARNLQADIATIKANLGFAELERMREASPTGGALGQVAVQELNYLQSAVANLDQAQSPPELKRALENIKTTMKGYQTLRERAYEKDYGQKFDLKKFAGQDTGEGEKPAAATGAQGAPKKVTKEEFDSLPSGALFTDPNGQIRRKP